MFVRFLRGVVGAAFAVTTTLAPVASGDSTPLLQMSEIDTYAVADPAEYTVMDGGWYAFTGPPGVRCVINITNNSYGCSGPLPGAPGGANLVSASASGAPAFSTTDQPIFATARNVQPLRPNTRLAFGDISCGGDTEGAVACVNRRENVGFFVGPSTTFISGLSTSPVSRLFTGDYCTGDLSQWDGIQNVTAGGGKTPGAMNWNDYRHVFGTYPVTVVPEDTRCGYAARFEIRTGDAGEENERSEVAAPPAAINVTRWEAFSIKFDPTYPLSITEGWAVTNQWADANGLGWVISQMQVDGTTPSGYWTLNYYGGQDKNIRLLDVPMDRGNWIDVKMQIGWYDNPSGFVRVWINGKRQILRYSQWGPLSTGPTGLSPSDTFTGQTVWNNTTGTFYYKEGLYRGSKYQFPTGIVYHANYRTAADEASL